jgi:hypothetical protein
LWKTFALALTKPLPNPTLNPEEPTVHSSQFTVHSSQLAVRSWQFGGVGIVPGRRFKKRFNC